jgi:dUTP pyrophosphatase
MIRSNGKKIEVKYLHTNLHPIKSTNGSAAYDLQITMDFFINPHSPKKIPTGLYFEIPQGYEMEITPRSSVFQKGIMISGKVDSDYRGEIHILAFNMTEDIVMFNKGDRIAQATFRKVEDVFFQPTDKLSETSRGNGGFGSTGR